MISIDATGQRDFIKNTMIDTPQAECDVLIVATVNGKFEVLMPKNMQPQERTFLAHILVYEKN